ncbi:MAG: HAD hydrolase-like protein [Phyllobacteriaceae bacterium]|nr:HAD hydrolase-like protein [Phyllobacteriaceae bacterium]
MLFDLDGTLVHHVNPRVLQMLEFLDDCSHRTGRLVARFRLRRRVRSAQAQRAPKLLVHKAIHKVRRKSVEQMLEPCSAMRATLERLRDEGVILGVVSNGLGRGYGHQVLEAFDLKKYFNSAVFREDVSRGKPWPDSIVKALQGIGRDLRSTDVIWYIGDQCKDITAAQAASAIIGRQIRPFALGARAALGAMDSREGPVQIVWTPADFERTVEATFQHNDVRRSLIDPLPAPLL